MLLDYNSSTTKTRILPLDGLRGIAVLLVIGFHYINNQYGYAQLIHANALERMLTKITYFGWVGVDLFFVLSGFLIGSILIRNRGEKGFFSSFYLRRFFRIVPVYYLLLIIFFILKHTSVYHTDMYMFQNDIPLFYFFTFLQNFVMSHQGNFGPEALTPTWSLAIEEQFYLIIPWVVYFLKPKQLYYFIGFCVITALVSRYASTNWYQMYTLLPSRIDSPAIGLLVACLMQHESVRNGLARNLKKVILVAVMLIIAGVSAYIFSEIGIFNHTVIAITFALILIITLHVKSGFFYQVLTLPVLRWVGAVSYFVYLFHQLINGLLHWFVFHQKLPVIDSLEAVFVTILAFLVTLGLAMLSFRYIEQPLIKFSHQFNSR